MKRYPISSFMKQKRGKRNWICLISFLVIIFMVKNFIHRPYSASAFDNGGKVNSSANSLETGNCAMSSTPGPISESALCQAPGASPESISDTMTGSDTKVSEIIQTRDELNNKILSTSMSPEQLTLVKNQLSQLAEK